MRPASGCLEGHSFCRGCYSKALEGHKKCPTCRQPVPNARELVRMRPFENMISQLRLQCDNHTVVEVTGLSAAKRRKGAGCGWRGRVAELTAHRGECAWAAIKCSNKGCTESPFRKDLVKHKAVCGTHKVRCSHCTRQMMFRSLAEHEARCMQAYIECPNNGCSARCKRGEIDLHRKTCPCASWVFDVCADGWEKEGLFLSASHDFGKGGTLQGKCWLDHEYPFAHKISVLVSGGSKCRVRATFSILDKKDKILCKLHETGTADRPSKLGGCWVWGKEFTPTVEEKKKSVHRDGTIRLRAEVRLFPHGAE